MKTPETITEIEAKEKGNLAPAQKMAIYMLVVVFVQVVLYLIPFLDNGLVKILIISFIAFTAVMAAPYFYFTKMESYKPVRKKSVISDIVFISCSIIGLSAVILDIIWIYAICLVLISLTRFYYRSKYLPEPKTNWRMRLDERERLIQTKANQITATAVSIAYSVFIIALIDHYGWKNLMPVSVLMYSISAVINLLLLVHATSTLILYRSGVGYEES